MSGMQECVEQEAKSYFEVQDGDDCVREDSVETNKTDVC